jgi:ArsR family transcriptional regulator
MMTTLDMIEREPNHPEDCTCCECSTLTPRLSDSDALAAATLFKALADPARLHILDVLGQQTRQVCVCDLEGVVGLPDALTGQRPRQATISHHLKVLRDAGLVGYQKRGLWVYYYVHRERLATIQGFLEVLRQPQTLTPRGGGESASRRR